METFFKYGNFLLEVSGSFWKFPNPNLELGSFGALLPKGKRPRLKLETSRAEDDAKNRPRRKRRLRHL